MAFDGVFVLIFARDFEFAGHEIRRLTHGQSGRGFLDSGSERGKKRWTEFREKLELLPRRFRAGEILEIIGRFLAENRANRADGFDAAGDADFDLARQRFCP